MNVTLATSQMQVTPLESGTIVNAFTVTNIDIPSDEQVFRYVALNANNYAFEHLSCAEQDGNVDVLFSHRVLGDFLDPSELQTAVTAVARVGEQDQRWHQGAARKQVAE